MEPENDPAPEPAVEPAVEPATPQAEDEGSTFTAEYVKQLRDESAAYRTKAKRVTDANARLTAAYAAQDGRLVDVEALTYSEDLLDDDGLVDRDRVAAAVSALITAKPYMARRTPITPIPQGVRDEAPEEVSLFGLMRGQ